MSRSSARRPSANGSSSPARRCTKRNVIDAPSSPHPDLDALVEEAAVARRQLATERVVEDELGSEVRAQITLVVELTEDDGAPRARVDAERAGPRGDERVVGPVEDVREPEDVERLEVRHVEERPLE